MKSMQLSRSVFIASAIVLTFSLNGAASKIVLKFDPHITEIEGVVETETFPGPPNYESIQNGDEIERGWYLRLDAPVEVLANEPPTDLGWKTEKNVKVIQLAMNPDNPQDWKKLKNGKRIKVRGKLFNRQTGHHHARVLMDVSQVTFSGSS